MLGLRTQESDEFMRFFKLVQKEAGKLNAVFLLTLANVMTLFLKIWSRIDYLVG